MGYAQIPEAVADFRDSVVVMSNQHRGGELAGGRRVVPRRVRDVVPAWEELIALPFSPFSPGLWLSLVLVSLLTAGCFAVISGARAPIERRPGNGGAGGARFRVVWNEMRYLRTISYAMLLSLFTAGGGDAIPHIINERASYKIVSRRDEKRLLAEAKSAEADGAGGAGGWSAAASSSEVNRATGWSHTARQILVFAWGFFVLLSMTNYQAQLTADIVSGATEVGGPVRSLGDCHRTNCNFCVNVQQESFFEGTFGSGINYLTPPPMTRTLNWAVHPSSECDAILASTLAFSKNFEEGFCDWTFVGPSLLAYMVSQPVRPSLTRALSYWLIRSSPRGQLKDGFEDLREKYLAPAPCNAFAGTAATRGSAAGTQISTPQFAGIFSILAVGIGVALLAHLLPRGTELARRGAPTKLEDAAAVSEI